MTRPLVPLLRSRPKAKSKAKKGGARRSEPTKDEEEDTAEAAEYSELQNVIRLDEQPKCIKGGKMREYQVSQ